MPFKVWQSAWKGWTSSSLSGLVLFPELACRKGPLAPGSKAVLGAGRAVLLKGGKFHSGVCPVWTEALFGLVGLKAGFSSSFHIWYCCAAGWSQGVWFLLIPLQFAMAIPFICFAGEAKKYFFSSSAFLFPFCHWISDVHLYTGRLGNLLRYCERCLSRSAKFYQPIACLSYHFAHLNFTQTYVQRAAFYGRPVLPYHFSVPPVILCNEAEWS